MVLALKSSSKRAVMFATGRSPDLLQETSIARGKSVKGIRHQAPISIAGVLTGSKHPSRHHLVHSTDQKGLLHLFPAPDTMQSIRVPMDIPQEQTRILLAQMHTDPHFTARQPKCFPYRHLPLSLSAPSMNRLHSPIGLLRNSSPTT